MKKNIIFLLLVTICALSPSLYAMEQNQPDEKVQEASFYEYFSHGSEFFNRAFNKINNINIGLSKKHIITLCVLYLVSTASADCFSNCTENIVKELIEVAPVEINKILKELINHYPMNDLDFEQIYADFNLDYEVVLEIQTYMVNSIEAAMLYCMSFCGIVDKLVRTTIPTPNNII